VGKSEVKLLVACGSGIATSTVAQEAIKKIVTEAGINAKILKCTVNELERKQNDVDIVLVTTNYKKLLNKPCISVFGLISGIKQEAIAANIIAECKKVLES
jgi:PTS system galactitol-specific IIB component